MCYQNVVGFSHPQRVEVDDLDSFSKPWNFLGKWAFGK